MEAPSATPRLDYLRITRDFVTGLQTLTRQFEDHPNIFDREFLEEAYKVQAEMIQQHFVALSLMYDREFMQPKEEKTPTSSIILT